MIRLSSTCSGCALRKILKANFPAVLGDEKSSASREHHLLVSTPRNLFDISRKAVMAHLQNLMQLRIPQR